MPQSITSSRIFTDGPVTSYMIDAVVDAVGIGYLKSLYGDFSIASIFPDPCKRLMGGYIMDENAKEINELLISQKVPVSTLMEAIIRFSGEVPKEIVMVFVAKFTGTFSGDALLKLKQYDEDYEQTIRHVNLRAPDVVNTYNRCPTCVTTISQHDATDGDAIWSHDGIDVANLVPGSITCFPDYALTKKRKGVIIRWMNNDNGRWSNVHEMFSPKKPRTNEEIFPDMRFAQIDCGWDKVIGLDESNQVYTWGCNHNGGLGRDRAQSGPINVPTALFDFALQTSVQVATCKGKYGLTAARTSLGIYACGNISSKSCVTEFTPIDGIDDPIDIQAGRTHMYVLTKTGKIYVFGDKTEKPTPIYFPGTDSDPIVALRVSAVRYLSPQNFVDWSDDLIAVTASGRVLYRFASYTYSGNMVSRHPYKSVGIIESNPDCKILSVHGSNTEEKSIRFALRTNKGFIVVGEKQTFNRSDEFALDETRDLQVNDMYAYFFTTHHNVTDVVIDRSCFHVLFEETKESDTPKNLSENEPQPAPEPESLSQVSNQTVSQPTTTSDHRLAAGNATLLGDVQKMTDSERITRLEDIVKSLVAKNAALEEQNALLFSILKRHNIN